MKDVGKGYQGLFVRGSMAWLMNRMSEGAESLWATLPAYLRQMWEDFQNAVQIHLTPGERFGREAVYVFLVGTVPALLAGSTSAALLLGIAPGFIAGLGMIVAFSHCQTKRSRERRMKVRCHQIAIATIVFLNAFCKTIHLVPGLMLMWMSCQQAALIVLISEMKREDFRFLFPKSVLPRWIASSDDTEKVTSTPTFKQLVELSCVGRWTSF